MTDGAEAIFLRLRTVAEDIEERTGRGEIDEEAGKAVFRQMQLLVELAEYTGIRIGTGPEIYEVSPRRLNHRLEILVQKGYLHIMDSLDNIGYPGMAEFVKEFTGAIASAHNIHRPGPGVHWRE